VSLSLKARIQADLADARRAQDRARVLVLGTILSDLRNREIDEGGELDEGQIEAAVQRAIKQRREAAEQMRDGGRGELAEREEQQIEILQAYLPEQMTEEEVRSLIRDLIAGGADQMGPLMGQLMPRLQGRYDGREANRLVREELGA
jgi:uncharacterized protein YqeY